ncbi:lysozyme inhibitor LprI family protein [Sphingomonas immobilis]|uniref:Lysozyme inhibitor LprI N-terminal domain-containing protein n=1 Tax=Sphingomonas immobilis TaxID=3063997 RepID=A0ABT8ZYJ8_9SPHN|nr:hypothetical protein [Sphingomonas sp. CA1-15]MDO7842652.1 hypothetical protein [Sphingomonas sp. CA1-15]
MITLLLLAAAAGGPSFDCAKASHPLEKTICASPKLSKLDADVAALYRERLSVLFDKGNFRGQQRDWQALMRRSCAKTCDAKKVEEDYEGQLTNLQGFETEDFEANYKTADIAYLHVEHRNAREFLFSLRRSSVDDDSKNYCMLPKNDGDSLVATITGPTSARWTSGADTVDFTFKYDKSGALTELVLTGSPATKRFCPGGNYRIDDRFISANNWVAPNQ